jgi:hypothetical protein
MPSFMARGRNKAIRTIVAVNAMVSWMNPFISRNSSLPRELRLVF